MKNEVKELNMEALDQVYGGSRFTNFLLDTIRDAANAISDVVDTVNDFLKPKIRPVICNND